MNFKKSFQYLYKILIICLPLFAGILATLASNAHFKNFCIIKFLIKRECFGCGLTRALAALCRLDFQQAYNYNPLIFIIVPMLFFIWIIIIKNEFKSKN